ncbi:hypothetical protein FRC10_008304 [Ceratobasidium sp. 414]|nr:hypothetical protein FRC10_008304 [Ceratobasidium sp. 414]
MVNPTALVDNQMHNPRAVLNGPPNESSARAPIGNLPPEILTRIFSIAVSSTPCFPAPGHRNSLLDIPSVCARWRHIAINARSLWSHIDVRVSPSADACAPSLDLFRVFADRCCGMPIHLHLLDDRSIVEKGPTTELISTLQPYAASLSSLIILGKETDTLAQDIFTLCTSSGRSDSVKYLVISENVWSHGYHIILLPADLFRGLTHLQLEGPRKSRIFLGRLVTTLSNCPTLHALILRNFWVILDQQADIHIPLLHLRLLRIQKIFGEGARVFLSMLHPGTLELDLTLDFISREVHQFTPCVRSFLARSNVVSLTVGTWNMEFGAYISSAPRLRTIIFNARACNGSEILEALLHGSVAQLPNLRGLCFIDNEMYADDMDRVKRLVQSKQLHTLGFFSCHFPPHFGEQLQNEDDGEDNIGGDRNRFRSNYREMPKDMREWLSERVRRVIVIDVPRTGIHQSVDSFVQELISLD